jgi:GntR family transcriptional regulator, transcriptional repressor for pyruvate dehydrogenase complex
MICYKGVEKINQDEPSLVRKAEDQIRRQILKQGVNDLLPSQGELAATLGVSRIVVREAMKHLEAEGLIEIAQGRRIRVKPAGSQASIRTLESMLRRSDGTLADLLEVRRPLEGEIAALAAERITAEQIAVLEGTIVELEALRTLERRVSADLLFHRTLAEATGNPVFPLLLDTIAGLLRASRVASIGTHGVGAAVEGHREILQAVKSRNPKAARDAMLRHLQYNEKQLKDTPLW